MTKNKINLAFAFIFLVLTIQLVSADITIWRDVVIDNENQLVKSYGYAFFDDKSETLLGSKNPIPVAVHYSWQNIPYNITPYYPQYPNALIDYCNLTILQDKYTFNDENNIIAYDEISYNQLITSQSAGNNLSFFLLKHKETLRVSFDCHYTNPDTLFIEGILFGDFGFWYPAFTCNGCEEFKLEELAKEIEYMDERVQDEISIYQKIQSVIKLNVTLWAIFSWVFKIIMVIGAVLLIFLMVYFFYALIEALARR